MAGKRKRVFLLAFPPNPMFPECTGLSKFRKAYTQHEESIARESTEYLIARGLVR
jgi:hypothetical protein